MHRESTQMRRVLVLALLVLFVGVNGATGQEQSTDQDAFPYPAALRPQVEFWKKIFATYSKYQVVIHDTEYINKIYKVLDFRSLLNEEGMDEAAVLRIREKQTKRELENIRAILLRLHRCGGDCGSLDEEEEHVWNLYRDVDDQSKFRQAADEDRLRSQPGLRERFGRGIEISRRYLPEMEQIFRREGVPIELTRLPLIESCFDLRAYSKAAAAGVWQFIPSTGRLYMRIDGTIDERRDPLIAAQAAARLLKANYEMLGAWPLAVTAYNHGPYGMFKAAKTLGTTDIAHIIRYHRGKSFGFASKNFYAEFLAALEVEKNHREYFGPLEMEPPLQYEEVRVEDYIALKHVAHCANATEEQILFLNPALQGPIHSGRARIPRGYRLRVPAGSSREFDVRYAALSPDEKASSQKQLFATHKVRRGQTLAKIARLHNISVASLKRLNGMGRAGRVRVGQALRVPDRSLQPAPVREVVVARGKASSQKSGRAVASSRGKANSQKRVREVASRSRGKASSKKPAYVMHKVRQGQTLAKIAERYNTSVASLQRVNGVRKVRRLQVGQVLRVPVQTSTRGVES